MTTGPSLPEDELLDEIKAEFENYAARLATHLDIEQGALEAGGPAEHAGHVNNLGDLLDLDLGLAAALATTITPEMERPELHAGRKTRRAKPGNLQDVLHLLDRLVEHLLGYRHRAGFYDRAELRQLTMAVNIAKDLRYSLSTQSIDGKHANEMAHRLVKLTDSLAMGTGPTHAYGFRANVRPLARTLQVAIMRLFDSSDIFNA